jgi:hypothetical protein
VQRVAVDATILDVLPPNKNYAKGAPLDFLGFTRRGGWVLQLNFLLFIPENFGQGGFSK